MAGNALVWTGGPGPCHSALPDRRVFCCQITKGLGIHIFALAADDRKHAVDKLEFDGVHDAAVRLALCPFAFVICPELRVVSYCAAGTFG